MDFLLGVITSLFFISTFLYISTRKKIIALKNAFDLLYESNKIFQEIINSQPTKEEEDIHKENFIKFLSDSREWAYDYIESLQSGLKKFIDEIEPEINYYDNYGATVDGMISPHDKALKKISTELKELKQFLPEEIDDRR